MTQAPNNGSLSFLMAKMPPCFLLWNLRMGTKAPVAKDTYKGGCSCTKTAGIHASCRLMPHFLRSSSSSSIDSVGFFFVKTWLTCMWDLLFVLKDKN